MGKLLSRLIPSAEFNNEYFGISTLQALGGISIGDAGEIISSAVDAGVLERKSDQPWRVRFTSDSLDREQLELI